MRKEFITDEDFQKLREELADARLQLTELRDAYGALLKENAQLREIADRNEEIIE